MNAVIALCNFCETHGPRAIFCTQIIRDSKIDNLLVNFDTAHEKCPGCESIGNNVGMLSEDTASNVNFLSTQAPVFADVAPMIKQAAVRSLSCEINNTSSDGNVLFFGDASRGHVLSHTFNIHDSQARGFFRLFSLIVLMKDKQFLLNMQPFLARNLLKLSAELQSYSSTVYSAEQAERSERAQRLTSGQTNSRPPRSLIELTNESSVFAVLHSHFVWMLSNGARYFTENVTIGSPTAPPWIGNDEDGFSTVQMDKEDWLIRRFDSNRNDSGEGSLLRKCRNILKEDFRATCYCALVGIQVILRGPQAKTLELIRSLSILIPDYLHKMIRSDCKEYVPASECRLLAVQPSVAVPQPCASVFRIDFMANGDGIAVKWLGEMPSRQPDLLARILKAVDEKLLSDSVLEKHVRVLVEEWQNKVSCMNKVSSNEELIKIKKILGVQQQDQTLVNYWNQYLS